MTNHPEDTIVAIATPIGEGGISVIRLSGPAAFEIAAQVFYPKKDSLKDFPSHTIHLGVIQNENGEVLDQVLASIFRAPHSYTGEDVIEISSHGGLIVTRHILNRLVGVGARHAEPGEFTKRAFLNGRIDLTQAEAVLDLIRAKSEKSLEIAARQLTGSLSQKFKSLRDELMQMYAHMEAYLDFPDEHLEVYSDDAFGSKFTELMGQLKTLIASFKRGGILREGVSAVIVGKPNVGKSSLFNALLARDRALVSEFPGTTRDALEEAIEIEGIYIRLLDTAGLQSGSIHPLDQMGMEKTKQALKQAQFFLYVIDASAPLDESDRIAFQEIDSTKPFIVLANKADLASCIDPKQIEKLTGQKNYLAVSAKNRQGLEELEKKMTATIWQEGFESSGEEITRLRHKNALESALESLSRAHEAFQKRQSMEFVIVDLKHSLDSLRELIGEIYSEDLLDIIFSEFCIGK